MEVRVVYETGARGAEAAVVRGRVVNAWNYNCQNYCYFDIKQLVRNSIIYSFAPAKTKQALLTNLDNEFAKFESK